MQNLLIGQVFFYQKKLIKNVLLNYMIFVEFSDNIADDPDFKIRRKKIKFKKSLKRFLKKKFQIITKIKNMWDHLLMNLIISKKVV